MKFTWNEAKRQANKKKHKGLDFADAETVFNGPTATDEDARTDYGEQRWNTIGLLGLKVVVIAHN